MYIYRVTVMFLDLETNAVSLMLDVVTFSAENN